MTELLEAAREVVRLFTGYNPNPDATAALARLDEVVARCAAHEQAERVAAALGSTYALDLAKGEVVLTIEGQQQVVKLGSPFWSRLIAWAGAA